MNITANQRTYTTLTAKDLTAKAKKVQTGKALANKKITMKVSITGKIYTIITDKNGIAK